MRALQADERYDSLIKYYAEGYGLDPLQIKRQIRRESNFNPKARSPAGAIGLMQFMPSTWTDIHGITADLHDMFNPELSIQAGCHYMSILLKDFYNDLTRSLAAYNWGSGHVRKLDIATNWLDECPLETREYVVYCLNYKAESLA